MAVRSLCPVCRKYKDLTKHHVFPKYVWINYGKSKKLLVCRDCHNLIHKEISNREKEILREFPEIYTDVVEDYVNGLLKVEEKKEEKRYVNRVYC